MRTATALLALVAYAEATQYTWRGIIDNQWTTPKNWEPATSAAGPGDSPSDVVTIDDNEGKNAVVELTQPKRIAQLNMGDKLGITATLRLLNALTVSQSTTVQPNGVLQLNAGLAGVSCPAVDVQGKLQFYSGLLTGGVKVHGPGKADFGSANYQGAKVFDSVTVAIDTKATVNMGGSLQFGTNAVITATSGIEASGQNFQMVLKNASTGKGNSYTSPSFNWTQAAPQVALVEAAASCTAADAKIWNATGFNSFQSDMTSCGGKCLGRQSCVTTCIQQKDGYSAACSGCFGALAQCTATNCLTKCLSGRNPTCVACLEAAGCDKTFETCSGFTPPQ